MKKSFLSFATTMFLLLSFETVSALCFLPYKPTIKEIRMQYENDYKIASAIFNGEVIRLDKFKVGFRVDKVWKGEMAEELIISNGIIDEGNGKLKIFTEVTRFKFGEKYLVYATGSGEKMISSSCTGTGQLKNSDDRIKFLQEIKLQKEKVVRSTKKKN